MKQTVFRKVMVKDRLPIIFGQYITDEALLYYHNGDEYFVDRHGYLCYPDWWLEEIELPTEQELTKEFGDINSLTKDDGSINNAITKSLLAGANYVLNKLK